MPDPHEMIGRPASAGCAIGPIWRLPEAVAQSGRAAADPASERAALLAAITEADAELAGLERRAGAGDAADVLEFQRAMLADVELRGPAEAAIANGVTAEVAWHDALEAQIADYEAAGEEYFRARAADLRDLRDRVLRYLAGMPTRAMPPRGAILAGTDITPTQFLEADWSAGGGIALTAGSPTSHVAMLARARGVPMVVGLGTVGFADHAMAAIDGAAGRLVLSPGEGERATMAARAELAEADRGQAQAALRAPAFTADGVRVRVMINLADPAELTGLDPAICDGVGLVRTELLFRDGSALPDEESQYAVYRRILAWADGRPVTIRTLDAGGDKPIAGLTQPGESNPFLGLRGVRLLLARPDVFRTQLRALLRAATHGPLKIMLPMVTVPHELEAARALLASVMTDLGRAGAAYRAVPLGIMVEVPATALAIERFDADFFSIGSNDLTQYVTASARDIGSVASLADPLNPAVLRLLAEVAAHGARSGREVSLCGDMAGEPACLPALLAAGLRTLSMAPIQLGSVKAALGGLRAGDGAD
jgi:phosphotransferase system enzyme I (PtsI)